MVILFLEKAYSRFQKKNKIYKNYYLCITLEENRVYQEFNPVEVAKDDLDIIDLQIDAMNAARDMDVDFAEAIMRVEVGSNVAKMSSKEIKTRFTYLC